MLLPLFPVVHDVNTSSNNSTKDLSKMNDWAIQWRIKFNPDPSKQYIQYDSNMIQYI